MPALLHIFVNSFFVQRCTNIAGRFKAYITFPVRAVGVMGYRRGVWQTNISPWDSHLPCKASDWKWAGSFLFCLLVCLSYILSSSLCFHSFSSIAPFFIPYVFFRFFCYSELFSWNEAICHKYSHIVYRACFKTYRALYAGREGVRRSLSFVCSAAWWFWWQISCFSHA